MAIYTSGSSVGGFFLVVGLSKHWKGLLPRELTSLVLYFVARGRRRFVMLPVFPDGKI